MLSVGDGARRAAQAARGRRHKRRLVLWGLAGEGPAVGRGGAVPIRGGRAARFCGPGDQRAGPNGAAVGRAGGPLGRLESGGAPGPRAGRATPRHAARAQQEGR